MIHEAATRRAFLRSMAVGSGALAATSSGRAASAGWGQLPGILRRIKPPSFPRRHFDVTSFGAAGDGGKDSTEAIARAIAACAQAGGGRVVVPAGDYPTGAIHLKSNVNLVVSAGATLKFSRDPKSYLPLVFTRYEGVECMNYSPLVYALGQQNIAVTGAGTLDGQADEEHWWNWRRSQGKARTALFQMGEKDVPVSERLFGEGAFLRPSLLQTYQCKNVLIEGITVRNTPMWQLNPVLCDNVVVRRVRMISHGPNNDGCDPECCRDVLIQDCLFDAGDDCIAIKSGRNRDGRRVAAPSENIVVRGCQMKDGHGGVTIGSEASGGVRNVFAENCQMDSPHLDRVLRLKTNSVRGGAIEHVYMRKVAVGEIADAVLQIDLFYEEGDKGGFPPSVHDIEMRDVTCRKSARALDIRGYPSAPVRDVRLVDCVLENVAQSDVIQNVEGLHFTRTRVNGLSRTE